MEIGERECMNFSETDIMNVCVFEREREIK